MCVIQITWSHRVAQDRSALRFGSLDVLDSDGPEVHRLGKCFECFGVIADSECDMVGGALLTPGVYEFMERLFNTYPGIRVANG